MAPLRCAAKFDPSLSLVCARVEGRGAEGSNFWNMATLMKGAKKTNQTTDEQTGLILWGLVTLALLLTLDLFPSVFHHLLMGEWKCNIMRLGVPGMSSTNCRNLTYLTNATPLTIK